MGLGSHDHPLPPHGTVEITGADNINAGLGELERDQGLKDHSIWYKHAILGKSKRMLPLETLSGTPYRAVGNGVEVAQIFLEVVERE